MAYPLLLECAPTAVGWLVPLCRNLSFFCPARNL